LRQHHHARFHGLDIVDPCLRGQAFLTSRTVEARLDIFGQGVLPTRIDHSRIGIGTLEGAIQAMQSSTPQPRRPQY